VNAPRREGRLWVGAERVNGPHKRIRGGEEARTLPSKVRVSWFGDQLPPSRLYLIKKCESDVSSCWQTA